MTQTKKEMDGLFVRERVFGSKTLILLQDFLFFVLATTHVSDDTYFLLSLTQITKLVLGNKIGQHGNYL